MVAKYQHLFVGHNPKLPFVTFQQTVLKEKVKTLTAEEQKDIQDFIDTQLQQEIERREHPWRVLKVDEGQSDVDLEKQYLKE